MNPITKEQRQALKRIYCRQPLWKDGVSDELAMNAGWRFVQVSSLLASVVLPPDMNLRSSDYVWMHGDHEKLYHDSNKIVEDFKLSTRLSYIEFRRTVQKGYDCLMVRLAGMWLGIEADGYTHS
jgi:hypothetical protein